MRHKRYRYAMIDEIRHRFFVFILFISQPSQTNLERKWNLHIRSTHAQVCHMYKSLNGPIL